MANWYQTWKVYPQLPMKHSGTLPDEGMVGCQLKLRDDLPPFDAYVKPKPAAGVRWGHRVIVCCPCGAHVPFGRMCQHWRQLTCGAV